MKTIRPTTCRLPGHYPLPTTHYPPRGGGAVLIVVLSLMAALAFLGFFFYAWTDNESLNAENFGAAPDAEIDPDPIGDFALQQILVSTPVNLTESALHGGQFNPPGGPLTPAPGPYSLLAHILGRINPDGTPFDVNPHSGRGVGVFATGPDSNGDGRLEATTATEVEFDYDGDGTPDANGETFVIHFGPSAMGGGDGFNYALRPGFISEPDAGYTYPDLNSLFLAYDAVIQTAGGTERIVIPSYFRPQLFPDRRAGGFGTIYTDRGEDLARDFYDSGGEDTNANGVLDLGSQRVLRPHAEHRNNDGEDRNGNGITDPGEPDVDGDSIPNPGTRRYVTVFDYPTGGAQAQSGDRNRIIGLFPFSVDVDGDSEDANRNGLLDVFLGEDINGNFTLDGANEMGIFSGSGQLPEFDADADGDGILDAIWLDLDHPIINLSDGRQAVPLFYVKIIDADALLNVNHHGDAPLFTAASNDGAAVAHDLIYELPSVWLHASNLGLTPAEVNLLPALYADPTSAAFIPQTVQETDNATIPHRGYYSEQFAPSPVDRTKDGVGTDGFDQRIMANTELAMLLYGRPEYDANLNYVSPNPADVIPGRYGDAPALRPALGDPGVGPLTGTFPAPGAVGLDDDGDDNDFTNDSFVAPADNVAGGRRRVDDFFGRLAPPITLPPAVHPLDFTGIGSYFVPGAGLGFGGHLTNTPAGGRRLLAGLPNTSPANPSRWLYYGFDPGSGPVPAAWQNQDDGLAGAQYGIRPWTRAGNPALGDYLQVPAPFPDFSGGPSVPYDGLWNEADEVTAHAEFANIDADLDGFPDDAPFPPAELLALHLSDSQWQAVDTQSRLRRLMQFNLETNRQAADIRSQFTTDSRNRLEHGLARTALGVGTRDWEFNLDSSGDGIPRFPPAFGPPPAPPIFWSRHEGMNPPANSVPVPGPATPAVHPSRFDPFRPVVRRLLAVEDGTTTNIAGQRFRPGQRLNINRLLVNFDQNGNPVYRHLIPHAQFVGTETDTNVYLQNAAGDARPVAHAHPSYAQSFFDPNTPGSVLDPPIPGNLLAGFPLVPFAAIASDPFAQEAWARHDRQRLARDIYVLLYTLGAGSDLDAVGDLTSIPYPLGAADADGNGINDLVEAMAQFAVNYVDALDADNVITRFEYDGDLSDGWNNPPSLPGVANGVEAHSLTFSEVMWIRTLQTSSDLTETIYPDDDREHQFLYIELRNASPFPVELNPGSYRIVRRQVSDGAARVAERLFPMAPGGPINTVGPGANFHIATHDGSITVHQGGAMNFGDVRSSDFYADFDMSGADFDAIVPNGPPAGDPGATPPPPPLADLDLASADPSHMNRHYLDPDITDPNPDTLNGKLVGLSNPLATDTVNEFILTLERRRNLFGGDLGEDYAAPTYPTNTDEDDWVEVDRVRVPVQSFSPNDNSEILAQLQSLKSAERRQPLGLQAAERGQVTVGTEDWMARAQDHLGAATRNHTIESQVNKHAANSQTAAPFSVWQPHFDREFSSIYELLSVPVFRSDRLVEQMTDGNRKLSGIYPPITGPNPRAAVAGELVLHPDGDLNGDGTQDQPELNRWYRLFEMFETAPRAHDTVRDRLSLRRRTPAQINLNTLRHEHVFAGLLDENIQMNTLTSRPTEDLKDPPAPPPGFPGRNWYDQLLIARDGFDPFTAALGLDMPNYTGPFSGNGLALPGVPGAQPFRSMSYIDPQLGSGPTPPDQLLANTLLRGHVPLPSVWDENFRLFEARATSDVGTDDVDYHTRNRLLSKIANNSTNRSHVFMIWLGYELFEAHQPNPAAPDVVQIGGRITDIPGHREFVVVDMTRLEEAHNPVSGAFDFRKFIIYRKRIQ